MTTYRRSHRRLVPIRRGGSPCPPSHDPDGWVACVLAVLAPMIVAMLAYLYALALHS